MVRVNDRWIRSIAAVPSQLPAQFMDEVEVGCEAGYFNGGDKVVTCLGSSFYHVKNSGPLCSARKFLMLSSAMYSIGFKLNVHFDSIEKLEAVRVYQN